MILTMTVIRRPTPARRYPTTSGIISELTGLDQVRGELKLIKQVIDVHCYLFMYYCKCMSYYRVYEIVLYVDASQNELLYRLTVFRQGIGPTYRNGTA